MNRRTTDPGSNQLIGILPERERRRVLRTLEPISLRPRQVLAESGRPVEYVYFPNRGCLIELSLAVADDRRIGAGLVGVDGLVGVEVLLESRAAQFTATVLARGESFRVGVDAFRGQLSPGGALAVVLRHYVQFVLHQAAQLIGCHRFHPLEQLFSSVLLRMGDQAGRDDLAITHEHFARLLGVRRVGITQVALKFQDAGLIRYRWGKLIILDREGLKDHACICHEQIKQAYRELLGAPRPLP